MSHRLPIRACLQSLQLSMFTVSLPDRNIPHSTEFSGRGYQHSSKAAGSEDLEIEQPVVCRDFSSFHFHPTFASMLGATLVGDQVVQMCQPREKCLFTATGMMKPLHA